MTHRDKFIEALERYTVAVSDYNDLGSIPVFGQDAEEQAAIDAARKRIKTAFTRTRNHLIKLGTET